MTGRVRRLTAIVAIVLAALLAPRLGETLTGARAAPFAPPSADHLLGTDALGRDVVAQLLLHAPSTFLLPAAAALALGVIGSMVGVLLGLAPRALSLPLLRAGDVLLVIPPVVMTFLIVLGLGASPGSIVVAVVLSGVVAFSRVIAASTRQLRHAGYVEAAIGLGDGPLRVAVRDVLPRLTAIVLAETNLRFLMAIQLVATLGFLGFSDGIGASWAAAIRENLLGFPLNPWAVLTPGLCLVGAVAGIALVAGAGPEPVDVGRSR